MVVILNRVPVPCREHVLTPSKLLQTQGTLRALSDPDEGARSHPFDKVQLVERRRDVGGVWYLDPAVAASERSRPLGNAEGEWPVRDASDRPTWPSPAYPALRGNVLPRFLSISGAPFPPPAEGNPFPTLDETEQYLRSAVRPFQGGNGAQDQIRTGVEVLSVHELACAGHAQGWRVALRDWNEGGQEKVEFWDAIVIATGWYDSPIYPPIPGLLSALSTQRLFHAKWYRSPAPFLPHIEAGRKIVVVGNGNSANDAASHLAPHSSIAKPVYRSILQAQLPVFVSLPDERIKDVPSIKEVKVKGERIDLLLADDQLLEDCVVLLGVGYEVGTIPWVHLLKSELVSSDSIDNIETSQYLPLTPRARINPASITNVLDETSTTAPTPSGALPTIQLSDSDVSSDTAQWPPRVPNLHHQILHGINPTLAFSGLPVSNTPFVLADMQMRYTRGVWDGSISLPSSRADRTLDEMRRVQVLEERKPQYASMDQALRADWERGRAQGLAEALRLAAPPSFGQPLYHMLPGLHADELEYAQHLRQEVIKAKPWLDPLLDKWDAARDAARQGMYNVKLISLVKAKLATLDASQRSADPRL
ncbi:Flavin-containing monooxygenase [Ceraceosorus bombacis]|uniref:Flavin-containing monooxygenase n=1 Tax=Ceraceosorus bombacis TaxID=401625 RepID=A0A0P1BP55_9BASI|nr:Flavin-containing monooxygenase [Ceraceosorus bombacis]